MRREADQSPDPQRMKQLLAGMVSFASENPPGREGEVALYLGEAMKGWGFSVETPEIAPGRRSVVATLDQGDGPTLAFNSHLDVVPAGGGWTSDPFRLSERGGRLIGRGACDAKGSIASMVEAMLMLKAASGSWRGKLRGIFVADEEVGGGGSLDFIARHPPVDRIIIGEPTSLATVSAHKGVIRPRIRISGKSSHSGMPELGDNAITAAGQLMTLFAAEDARLRQLLHPLCGKASLTVTRIEGGIADNVVPAACEMTIDRRMLPGETSTTVEAEIQALIERARNERGVRAEIIGCSAAIDGCETPVSDPVVTSAVETCAHHGVRCNGPIGFMGGCDLVHFVAAGSRGIVLGPGDLGVAHQPDEFVPIDQLATGALIYRDLTLKLYNSGALGSVGDRSL